MIERLRAWLFGGDSDQLFDAVSYSFEPAAEWPLTRRFAYKLAGRTVWRVEWWMREWDAKFYLRYLDLKKARHPERFVQ